MKENSAEVLVHWKKIQKKMAEAAGKALLSGKGETEIAARAILHWLFFPFSSLGVFNDSRVKAVQQNVKPNSLLQSPAITE